MHLIAGLLRRFGWDLVRHDKPRMPEAQLVHLLKALDIGLVLDVGANVGQYATRLREHDYEGDILSFEPLAELHARLSRAAAGDARWQIAPPIALGAADGRAVIEVSAESDMSSIRAQSPLLQSISPSSEVAQRRDVPLGRLDSVLRERTLPPPPWLLKIDTQGYEPEVLEGAAGIMDHVAAIQIEMALVPLYEGERDWRTMIDRLDAQGFELRLVIPGYFERKLLRQLQIDGVFVRRESTVRAPRGRSVEPASTRDL